MRLMGGVVVVGDEGQGDVLVALQVLVPGLTHAGADVLSIASD